MLYREWLNEWLELYVKVSVSERTYRKYRCQSEKYILPSLGERELSELTAVEKFSAGLVQSGLAATQYIPSK